MVTQACLLVLFLVWNDALAQTPLEERTQLEQELQALEKEIQSIEGDITKTKQQKQTLQNQVKVLQSKIQKTNLEIEKSTKILKDLTSQIADTEGSIIKTNEDIQKKRRQMAETLRRIWEEDQKGTPEIILTGATLSDFFSNIAALQALTAKNQELLEDLTSLTQYLENQKGALATEKTEEENFRRIQILQKQESQNLQGQAQGLLETTKGKESEYQKLLQDKKKRAQEIRSRIFELIGVPEAPTFGEALAIANAVSLQTGVRPAFLLAVITQESNLGKNVGQCFLKDIQTGSGTRVISAAFVKNVMKPSRDVKPFLEIVQELGRDPLNTPVSCPVPSVGGYGGAMGPAQFIPSTWKAYRSRLSAILGRPANPWDIKDAFMAAGLYLSDFGAAKQTYNAEWKSALIYFSGSSKTRYRFYGDSVMRIAANYEEDIKALNGSLSSTQSTLKIVVNGISRLVSDR
ncbi:MAG: hypothetical protein Greene071421_17 [Parcubacteria group bacterium Greene0714_21]|nr:MAG: hypothetical protein Greene041639_415 [Parcubacteria group bacterium Greene0416_39]TSC97952.1 MAG: hypothetical protein Greene101447_250 [Parcubacteria group bacterium Greene1014_47]TSD04531.1 MAG: hypothetical protein Greene071421_17 [Parcubacteria group bacterium Greene0714_21]